MPTRAAYRSIVKPLRPRLSVPRAWTRGLSASALAAALVLGPAAGPAVAGDSTWRDNLRATLDVATRSMWMSGDQHASAQFLGLDMHKVFTGASGDVGTLTVQPYLIHIQDVAMHPPFFDGPNDWAVEYRIVNFNYTGIGRGRTNLRIGHFEIPFGLEQIVNSNGTLRDYLHGSNIGVKADWGVSLNGDLDVLEYEVALTRGSGNGWSDRGDPQLVSGRVGTPRDRAWVAGVSILSGRVQAAAQPDYTLRRRRAALDVQLHGSRFSLMAEFAAGEDERLEVRTALLELGATTRDEALHGYVQLIDRRAERAANLTGTDHSLGANLGLAFAPDAHWQLSAQWSRDLNVPAGPRTSMFAGQLRYRF
jgi:hypothetical protein